MRSLLAVLLLGFPCAALLSIGGGYFLAGRALSPISAMASKAREITAESLSERLPVGNPDDELGRMATVFNETLARLEGSFDRLRAFVANTSHELRTPLTAMRSVGEVALRRPLDSGAAREAIGSMLEEVGRLTRMVECLLDLARAEPGA
jgi:signal transduction histidine kinase